MAGIYIHIPFCRQKCHYCNFFSISSTKSKEQFLGALIKEISIQNKYLDGESIETIYFGGGTPSLLNADDINRIYDELIRNFVINHDSEITLEANPDDLSSEKIKSLGTTPINRLSIGVQSFFDVDLLYLNRIHSAEMALASVKDSLYAGFTNISIDLIYGIPTLTHENWDENIMAFLKLNLPHLSAYALTVEPKTALDVLIRKKKMKPVDDEKSVMQFMRLMMLMKQSDYSHYEISNFCLDSFYSRHNTNYWTGEKYLGLGPAAHSFNGIERRWNVLNLTDYISAIEKGAMPSENEILTTTQQYNEYVLTSMRTIWGADSAFIENKFGTMLADHFKMKITKFQSNNRVIAINGKYFLSDEGKLFADGIASELFF